MTVSRSARDEESPAILLAAPLTQLFEVKHFTDWTSPQSEQVLMQMILCLQS